MRVNIALLARPSSWRYLSPNARHCPLEGREVWKNVGMRSYNTVRLTKGQRRRRKRYFVQKAKEREEMLKDKGLQRQGPGMAQLYARAHENFKEFLEEVKETFPQIHERVANFAKTINEEVRQKEEWIDLDKEYAVIRASKEVDSTDFRQMRSPDSKLLSLENSSSALVSPQTLADSIISTKVNPSDGASIANFQKFIGETKINLEKSSDSLVTAKEFPNALLSELLFKQRKAKSNKKQFTEKMILIIDEFAEFKPLPEIPKGQRSKNHRGERTLEAVYPDAKSVGTLLESCNQRKSFAEAITIYNHLSNKFNFQRDLESYIPLIRACGNSNNSEKAVKLFYDALDLAEAKEEAEEFTALEKSSHHVQLGILFKEAIRACSRNLYLAEEGEKMFELMMMMKLKPDKVIFSGLLSCYARNCDIDKAKEAWSKMDELQIKKDVVLYNNLLHVYSRNQWNLNRSKRSLFRDFDPLAVVDRMLDVRKKEEIVNRDQATLVAEYMPVMDLTSPRKNDRQPLFGGQIYDANVPEEFKPEQELDELEARLNEFESEGKADASFQDVLMRDLEGSGHNISRGKMAIFALEDREQMTRRNIDEATLLLHEMQEKGVNPDSVTLTTLLNLYAEAKDTEKVTEIYNVWFHRFNVPKTDRTFNALIKYHSKNGDLNQAVTIVSEALECNDLSNYSPELVGEMAATFARRMTEEDLEMSFSLIKQYKSLQIEGKGKFSRDLFEKHYRIIRKACEKLDIVAPDNLIPSDPNEWRSGKTIRRAINEVKKDKQLRKEAGILVSAAQNVR